MEDFYRQDISRLEHMLSEARSPVIVTHMRPDGDAMGSSIALYRYLAESGKRSCIVLNDRYPAYLSFLTEGIVTEDILIHSESPDSANKAITEADLIICLDFNAFHRTGNLEEALKSSCAAKILIDHHLNPDTEPFSLYFSETGTSSASELLYHILMATSSIGNRAENLPAKTAEALMTGMTTDTNNFANSVLPSTLRMASDLLGAGVDRDRILNSLYNCHSENRLRLMGHMMKDMLVTTDDGVAYIVLDKHTQEEYKIQEGDTEGFVNMPLSIADIRMSLLLKEDGDRIRVSIRSKTGVSANDCARLYFNGGGHENAAGGRLNIPQDINNIEEAAAYIEKHTHIFFEHDEKNR